MGLQRFFNLGCIAVVLAAALPALANDAPGKVSVGMAGRLEQVVLPGPELEVKPITEETPVIVRIVATYPHGSDFRYDLEYYALKPGVFNLSDYLQRKDQSAGGELPQVAVTIESVLAADRVEPNALTPTGWSAVGGYQTLMILAGVVWLACLMGILMIKRKRDAAIDGDSAMTQRSLADRLNERVDEALRGELSREEMAELELMLVSFWRKKLGWEDKAAAHVMSDLRNHPDAGPLLRQLEEWLHRPADAAADAGSVDVAQMLQPYRNLPADALEPVSHETVS